MLGLGLNLTGFARTAVQRIVGEGLRVLRRFGQDAHVYLPGVGMLNGLQAANFIDSAGTQQGAVDQPVGLALDAAGGLGVELVTTPNQNGVAIDGVASIQTYTVLSSIPSATKTYRVSCVVSGYSGTGDVGFGSASFPSVAGVTRIAGNGVISGFVVGGGAGAEVFTRPVTNTANFSNISVREVTGIAASQPTTASKPILRRGAVNLQPYSNDYTTVAWTKNNIAAPTTGIADHLGGFTAQKIVANATSSNHYLSPGAGTYPAANITCTYAVIAKMSGESVLGIGIAGGTAFSATYDLLNGTTVANNVTSEIRPLGNGFYLCVMVGTPTAYANSLYITIRATQTTFLGDGVSGLILSGAALFQGTLTAAQIQALGGIPLTTTAAASTALGPYWLDTSGSKSLVATYPAGNESVTVIDAGRSTTTTLTAQNVVGAYNINADTSGRIIINGALTAPDLALLQTFATKLAGR